MLIKIHKTVNSFKKFYFLDKIITIITNITKHHKNKANLHLQTPTKYSITNTNFSVVNTNNIYDKKTTKQYLQ